jgi:hypothetical protein
MLRVTEKSVKVEATMTIRKLMVMKRGIRSTPEVVTRSLNALLAMHAPWKRVALARQFVGN